MRLFKALAILHIIVGSCIVLGVALGGLTRLLPKDDAAPPASLPVLAFSTFLAATFLYSGVKHLRVPNQKTALSLAGGLVALIWIAFTGVSARLGVTAPIFSLFTIGAAFAIYRFALKPAAETAFPGKV